MNQTESFDLSMGSLDSAKVTDLIGLFILHNLAKIIDSKNIELCGMMDC